VEDEPVIVEFYGIPRLRAGRSELAVPPGSAAAVLGEVVSRCPALSDLVTNDGRLSPNYLLSLDGGSFVHTLAEDLPAGTRLLILSADPGG
jgi:hypothetical protein